MLLKAKVELFCQLPHPFFGGWQRVKSEAPRLLRQRQWRGLHCAEDGLRTAGSPIGSRSSESTACNRQKTSSEGLDFPQIFLFLRESGVKFSLGNSSSSTFIWADWELLHVSLGLFG